MSNFNVPFWSVNIFLWTNTFNISVLKSVNIEEKNTARLVQSQHIVKHSDMLIFQLLHVLLCILHAIKCYTEMCSCYSCMCQQFVRPSVSLRQFKLFPFNFLAFWLCYIYLSEQGKGSSTSYVFLLIHTFHDGQLLCPTRRIELSVEGFFFPSWCSKVLFKLCKKLST